MANIQRIIRNSIVAAAVFMTLPFTKAAGAEPYEGKSEAEILKDLNTKHALYKQVVTSPKYKYKKASFVKLADAANHFLPAVKEPYLDQIDELKASGKQTELNNLYLHIDKLEEKAIKDYWDAHPDEVKNKDWRSSYLKKAKQFDMPGNVDDGSLFASTSNMASVLPVGINYATAVGEDVVKTVKSAVADAKEKVETAVAGVKAELKKDVAKVRKFFKAPFVSKDELTNLDLSKDMVTWNKYGQPVVSSDYLQNELLHAAVPDDEQAPLFARNMTILSRHETKHRIIPCQISKEFLGQKTPPSAKWLFQVTNETAKEIKNDTGVEYPKTQAEAITAEGIERQVFCATHLYKKRKNEFMAEDAKAKKSVIGRVCTAYDADEKKWVVYAITPESLGFLGWSGKAKVRYPQLVSALKNSKKTGIAGVPRLQRIHKQDFGRYLGIPLQDPTYHDQIMAAYDKLEKAGKRVAMPKFYDYDGTFAPENNEMIPVQETAKNLLPTLNIFKDNKGPEIQKKAQEQTVAQTFEQTRNETLKSSVSWNAIYSKLKVVPDNRRRIAPRTVS